jgi:hypothetical protein
MSPVSYLLRLTNDFVDLVFLRIDVMSPVSYLLRRLCERRRIMVVERTDNRDRLCWVL